MACLKGMQVKYTISTQNSANKTRNVFLVLFLTAFCSFAFAGSASAINYTIEYKENVATNMPESVLGGLSPTASALLSNNSPLRAGFQFLGWCDQATTKSGDTDTCASGHQHQPGGTVTLDATANANNIKLYAMWGPVVSFDQAFADAGKTKSNGYYKMQDTTDGICNNVTAGQTGILIDTRDNTTYHIGKLADGRCWMLDNLALDLTNDTILNGLSAGNTNIDTVNDPGALAALKGTTLGTTSDKYATSKVANWTSSYSYSAPLVNISNKDVVPQKATDPLKAEALAGNWKVGGYYNYCATTAGSYCYGSGTNWDSPSGNSTSSICPKGWRLPTGNGGEFRTLGIAITGIYDGDYAGDDSIAYRLALHLPLSGNFLNGSASNQEVNGTFSSSSYSDNHTMYYLFVGSTTIGPEDRFYNSSYGFTIRCILDTSGA